MSRGRYLSEEKLNKVREDLNYNKMKYYLVVKNMNIKQLANLYGIPDSTMSNIIKEKKIDVRVERKKYNEEQIKNIKNKMNRLVY